MKRLLVAASLFALLFPASAFAQQNAQQPEKVTEYTFKGINLDANRNMPLGERIENLRHQRTRSLYQARQNWVPELLESSREF
jgi:hypothetical protein